MRGPRRRRGASDSGRGGDGNRDQHRGERGQRDRPWASLSATGAAVGDEADGSGGSAAARWGSTAGAMLRSARLGLGPSAGGAPRQTRWRRASARAAAWPYRGPVRRPAPLGSAGLRSLAAGGCSSTCWRAWAAKFSALNGPLSHQQLIRHDGERIAVAGGASPGAPSPVPAKIGGRAEQLPGRGDRILGADAGDPEVGDVEHPPPVEQQVGRLDVAMDDPAAMGVIEGLGSLLKPREGVLAADLTHAQGVGDRAAREALHDDERAAGVPSRLGLRSGRRRRS